MASGCLGLISFPRQPGRLTLETIEALYPTLIEELRGHEGVGFLLVDSAADGALAIGADGVNRLEKGEVLGEDPLAPFGPNAARHVLRTHRFPHCPDIVVNSRVWHDPTEVAAFEELVGSHGGMGGSQCLPVRPRPRPTSNGRRTRSSAPRPSTACSGAGSPASVRTPTPTTAPDRPRARRPARPARRPRPGRAPRADRRSVAPGRTGAPRAPSPRAGRLPQWIGIATRGPILAAAPRRLAGVEVPGAEPRAPAGHRQERDVDLPHLADPLEPARVSGEVDGLPGGADDEAERVAAAVVREATPVVVGVDRLDLDVADPRVAAGAHHLRHQPRARDRPARRLGTEHAAGRRRAASASAVSRWS